MKMIYRKFPKTASLSVTCHLASYCYSAMSISAAYLCRILALVNSKVADGPSLLQRIGTNATGKRDIFSPTEGRGPTISKK